MNRILPTHILLTLIILLGAAAAQAQTAPFDMSGERPKGASPTVPQTIIPQTTTPQVEPPKTTAPSAAIPQAIAPKTITPQVTPPLVTTPPAGTPQTAAPQATTPVAPAQASPQATPKAKPATAIASTPAFRRYVVPFAKLRLEGEADRRSWSIYLTPEQAAAPAKLSFAYQNAVVVAPETSQLTVLLNDRVVHQQQIGSSDNESDVTFDVPRGLLQPGANLLTFEVAQRHRVDCDIPSTYELWSDIDPAKTYLSFASSEAERLSTTDAIRAIGVDGAGKTQFNLVVPALAQPGTTKPILRLAQGLALLSGMPNETFSFDTDALPLPGPGKMAVIVGTPAELQPVFAVPAAAQNGALATFATDPRSGQQLLLISGPSWQAISSAIDMVVSPTDRDPNTRRDLLVTQRWTAPDAPLIYSDTSLSFDQLGVKTTEFSGRRFHTSFNVAIPSDFYANAYGEATILLDAAYAKDVRPGSHIDVYVNGSIATTKPITATGGGIFRQLPIRITMRHFKPGLNTITLEAILLADEDSVCAPAATSSTTPRFALFDTSQFRIPDFARVAQRPNLAAFAGTGYPYNRGSEPTALFIDRADADTLSAAATLLGRMALIAGHPIAVDPTASSNTVGTRNALFIGSVSQLPSTVLTQMNISSSSQVAWRPPAPGQPGTPEASVTIADWRSRISGGLLQGQMEHFQQWLHRNFDITLSSLRFMPSSEQVFTPSNANSLLIAQEANPTNDAGWTVVTAPSAQDLRSGVEAMTAQSTWSEIGGRITVYSGKTGKIDTTPVSRFTFITSQPWSLTNYRLIAANWLSSNILSYALLFVAAAFLLGISTASVLSKIGRRE
ncbi:cellulose biosynthesis cyclic di-GMP-binding regulatory protein BcsB [Rhizobium sp. P40RR-XXII]|uniref:cellulose biosynthesis cyclic di-GMP-binding regulatory protein BcsB n=1 Tax=unclassified Rhizobium TaxID=2613769 RepID=UPI001456A077|nr:MULTISPECIES: cellulose biosynthesis cyclic di-GMP-binding regulatory protein BcsB [unclassified Rhizobium]NLR88741.1 cellulose biosynthesis cyclic di-GMP-binding regulatory protein BcsB [Rhizobium sp. P28RR-XV]NLS20196.1 cellulose biosynthesis cyclic di-GMP-binding regulatory protein BcsB [Rhizobium sp. P40RR-XXII]